MKGITLCAECANYNRRKHCCTRGAKKTDDPYNRFYDDCPLDDVAPVVHGHWICEVTDQEKGFGKVTCSHCGYEYSVGVAGAKITPEYMQSMCEEDCFCRKCGAKMDKKEADDESQLD